MTQKEHGALALGACDRGERVRARGHRAEGSRCGAGGAGADPSCRRPHRQQLLGGCRAQARPVGPSCQPVAQDARRPWTALPGGPGLWGPPGCGGHRPWTPAGGKEA